MNIFVIAPFSADFHLVFAYLIKAPLQEKGHTVERSLESNHQHGLRAIIQGISNADLIIADLTTQNANVTYELGIAHSLRMPTLQIAQSLDDVRYVRPYNVILYSIESDGASGLANDILDYIERKPGNEYNFSNPVSDFTDSDRNTPIIISAPNILSNGQQLPLLHENELDGIDGSEYGIIDASADIENASAVILSSLQGLSSDIDEIGEKTRAHSSRINELNSNPNQQRRNNKAELRVLQHFASDVKDFSEKVNEKTPTLKEAWMTLDQSMELVLFTSNIENESDIEAIYVLISQASEMQKNIPNTIASIESFRDAQENLIGLSRVSNPALRGSIKALNRLIDDLKLGGSVVGRTIDLATDKIERYSEITFDENDNLTP